jgi:hypothetical protein
MWGILNFVATDEELTRKFHMLRDEVIRRKSDVQVEDTCS